MAEGLVSKAREKPTSASRTEQPGSISKVKVPVSEERGKAEPGGGGGGRGTAWTADWSTGRGARRGQWPGEGVHQSATSDSARRGYHKDGRRRSNLAGSPSHGKLRAAEMCASPGQSCRWVGMRRRQRTNVQSRPVRKGRRVEQESETDVLRARRIQGPVWDIQYPVSYRMTGHILCSSHSLRPELNGETNKRNKICFWRGAP